LNVQVLYSSVPPGLSARHASRRISSCRAAHTRTPPSLHSAREAGSLRNMPSPEQGASTATTSNHASKSQTARGSQVVTTTLPVPHLRTLSASTAARRRSISLATTSPSGPASEA